MCQGSGKFFVSLTAEVLVVVDVKRNVPAFTTRQHTHLSQTKTLRSTPHVPTIQAPLVATSSHTTILLSTPKSPEEEG